MNGRYDSIISINSNNMDKLCSDNEDVPNDFFTTYVRLILWEEENKMGGIHIDSNLFKISSKYDDADNIPFDHVSSRMFVNFRYFIEYIKESCCYHYFSIIFWKESNEIIMVEKLQFAVSKVDYVKKNIPIYADILYVNLNGLFIILISISRTMIS